MLLVQTHAGRLGSAWHAPESWSEAAALLARYGADAAVAGGATYLMWRAAHGEPMPAHLVSLHRIARQREIGPASVDALVTLRRLERATGTGPLRALTMAASVTAGPAVRTVATVGGNVASGFAQADLVPALLALDAHAHLVDGTALPVHQLLSESAAGVVGAKTEQRRATPGRIVTRVSHGLTAEEGWSGASVKLSRRGMDLSIGIASVVVRQRGGVIDAARVAVGSLFDRPCRLPEVEAAVAGAAPGDLTSALSSVDFAAGPLRTDAEASASYRARIGVPLVHRALSVAIRLGVDGTPEAGDARL